VGPLTSYWIKTSRARPLVFVTVTFAEKLPPAATVLGTSLATTR
jgi:hypothetical protein